MKLHNQPMDGGFGDQVISWLENSTGEFIAISAFAKNSGILLLENALKQFKENGGMIKFIVGIDLDGTSVEALKNLYRIADELFVIHSENNITFHPKIYSINHGGTYNIAVGSNNLTRGGLFNNFEASIITENIASTNPLVLELNRLIQLYSDTTNDTVRKIQDLSDIIDLQNNGYIKTEKDIQLKLIRTKSVTIRKKSTNQSHLFGKAQTLISSSQTTIQQHTPSPISSPTHAIIPNTPTLPVIQNEIFWFESGRMTGGSKNILDLSKSGKIQSGSAENTIYFDDIHNVQGGVKFFGLDPHVPQTKDIVINYNGENFFPATILYSDSNQNWRIQIKGDNDKGVSITSVIGLSMVDKLLLFDKVDDSHYILNIVPITEMSTLQNNSLFWATNGVNNKGRKFGYILKELEE
ncbi:TPA: hypothetical protein U2B00_002133 [Streptococcus suis]|nr:hypothetical protein [Streptococcus suis]HEM5945433.1 hypothetical protein [Streptococcus suis]HEM6086939.1 hypothetical protein [Streptococcus suis]HEM6087927.1 hypothetical protein [Streptococcus suis]HEM6103840.1 hypothetical protein [Streptococcus suis]